MLPSIPQAHLDRIQIFEPYSILTSALKDFYFLVGINKKNSITKNELIEGIDNIYKIFLDLTEIFSTVRTTKEQPIEYLKKFSQCIIYSIGYIDKAHLNNLFETFGDISDNNKSLFLQFLIAISRTTYNKYQQALYKDTVINFESKTSVLKNFRHLGYKHKEDFSDLELIIFQAIIEVGVSEAIKQIQEIIGNTKAQTKKIEDAIETFLLVTYNKVTSEDVTGIIKYYNTNSKNSKMPRNVLKIIALVHPSCLKDLMDELKSHDVYDYPLGCFIYAPTPRVIEIIAKTKQYQDQLIAAKDLLIEKCPGLLIGYIYRFSSIQEVLTQEDVTKIIKSYSIGNIEIPLQIVASLLIVAPSCFKDLDKKVFDNQKFDKECKFLFALDEIKELFKYQTLKQSIDRLIAAEDWLEKECPNFFNQYIKSHIVTSGNKTNTSWQETVKQNIGQPLSQEI